MASTPGIPAILEATAHQAQYQLSMIWGAASIRQSRRSSWPIFRRGAGRYSWRHNDLIAYTLASEGRRLPRLLPSLKGAELHRISRVKNGSPYPPGSSPEEPRFAVNCKFAAG